MRTDVIIIGAGLAGAISASALANAGFSVALIDSRPEAPREFRAEKMGKVQIAQLTRLGLADAVLASVTEHRVVKIARFGRIVGDGHEVEYGFQYSDLVNALRRAVPAGVLKLVGRVDEVSTSSDLQRVTMADRTIVEARLLVIATGLGDAVRKKAGLERNLLSRAHSLALGFDWHRKPADYAYDTLVCYPEQRQNRIAYMSVFRLGDVMRGNLFVYRPAQDAWIRQLREAPRDSLRAAMPELERLCGGFDVAGPIDVRSIDLTATLDYRRDGVVLIGDAFRTCCPIIGMGVPKVLTDVERLCSVHAPRWFESPGMGVEKIDAFYDDPKKLQCDATGHAVSVYARRMVTDPGFVWSARRVRNVAVRRGLFMLRQTRRRLRSGAA